MTKPTKLNTDLRVLNQLNTRVHDLDFLFRYPEYSCEVLIDYLVTDHGFDRDDLKDKATIEVWGEIEILRCEYGLSFDYIPSGTFEDQTVGYFRYQLSYGGPSEEFRFFVDPEHNLIKAEFWLLGWFTGSCLDCTKQQTVESIWEHFKDTESSQYAFRQAMTET